MKNIMIKKIFKLYILSLICMNSISAKTVLRSFEEEIDNSYSEKFSSTKENLTTQGSSKQVMLRVKIGEVNRHSMVSSVIFSGEKDMIRIFAEPTLVALSGTSAFFQSGGELPIVSQNGVEFKSYGLKVSFTPVVISSSRIRMEVYSEISELSKDRFVNMSSGKLPTIESRKAKTTIELAPGESFMIAGLVKDIVHLNNRDSTELVVSVTPYIVQPTSHIKLPTDRYYKHSNIEMKFMDNLSKNAGIASETEKLEGPTGLIAE